MKIKMLGIFLLIPIVIMAADVESWPTRFEQTKLNEKIYQEIGNNLAIHMPAAHKNNPALLDDKMWLMRQKEYRASFNNGSLDVAKEFELFKFHTLSSFSLPYKENDSAPLFKNYSKIVYLLLLMRFEKIVGVRKNCAHLSKNNDYSVVKKFLEAHEKSIPFAAEKEFEIKFQEIPCIVSLAIHIDETSTLAQAILKASKQRMNPLVPLNFAYYSLPIIEKTSLLSLNSSETEQSFISSSQISSDSRLSTPSYKTLSRHTTPSSDFSDDITTISSSSESSSYSGEISEERSGSDLIFPLDLEKK